MNYINRSILVKEHGWIEVAEPLKLQAKTVHIPYAPIRLSLTLNFEIFSLLVAQGKRLYPNIEATI